MGSLVSGAGVLLLAPLLASLFGAPPALGQDLRERDALCNADSCFAVHFQRRTFLDSWRACKEKGGNLATIKRREDASAVAALFSGLDLRAGRAQVRVWIGLQRQLRQCPAGHPLRGFAWTTGDQDTEYTNWQKEENPAACSAVPRCVAMGYGVREPGDNLKWLDGSCSVPVDGYLCHYAYKGMCPPLWSEGAGNALYATPFNLLSTLLTHVPFGSVATMPCPGGVKEEQSALCVVREDGTVGWSRDSPLCAGAPAASNWCDQGNGGCEHFCRPAGGHFYCECAEGYQLGGDGRSCEAADVCQGAPCEFECLPLPDGYRCACPDGYMLAPDERGCLDVDECLQSPCEQVCANAPGTFECRCREGYRPDGEGGCEDVDECAGEPCEHACENTQGSHVCHCHLGYSPLPEDPSRCQDVDECQIAGTCEQMCVNYDGGFECYCEEGYELLYNYSCRKTREGDDRSAVTPPFPWVTNQPGSVWDPMDYDWNSQQGHTDWPLQEEVQSLDWLTDPPRVLSSDVIWVTRAPQEEPFEKTVDLDPPTETPEYEDYDGVDDWSEPELLPSTTHPTPPPTTAGSSTTPALYEDDEDDKDASTVPPFLSTSTTSEGAWNWWAPSRGPGNPEDAVAGHNVPTGPGHHGEGEEQYPLGENPELPQEDPREDAKIAHSQDATAPTQLSPTQPPPSESGPSGDALDSIQGGGGQKQGSTWLLVGLLVPLCIFTVVMVALGIVYCTRCAAQPRNKNVSDCYHWISGAHDKQGAPNPGTGVKTHV